jgi:uncharacterized membrane protein YdjX (TVP38/TMEM64 family)
MHNDSECEKEQQNSPSSEGAAGRNRTLLLRLGLGILVLAALIFISYWYYRGEWREYFFHFKYIFSVTRLRLFILSFGPFSVVVFVILQALQVILAPFPGELTGFVGGYLYGTILGTILSTMGLTLGSIAAFEIARVFGTTLVRKIVRQDAMDRFDYFVMHRGLYVAFILFLIPGFPKDSMCYLLGLTHLRRFDFIMMNIFGRLPGTLLLSLQGEAVNTKEYTAFFMLLAGSIVTTFLLYSFRNSIVHGFSRLIAPLHKRK